jgi:hypothetical protein
MSVGAYNFTWASIRLADFGKVHVQFVLRHDMRYIPTAAELVQAQHVRPFIYRVWWLTLFVVSACTVLIHTAKCWWPNLLMAKSVDGQPPLLMVKAISGIYLRYRSFSFFSLFVDTHIHTRYMTWFSLLARSCVCMCVHGSA